MEHGLGGETLKRRKVLTYKNEEEKKLNVPTFFFPVMLCVIHMYIPQIISGHSHWAQDRLEVHVRPTASLRACVAYVLKEAVGM